jgi:hypothetical protein
MLEGMTVLPGASEPGIRLFDTPEWVFIIPEYQLANSGVKGRLDASAVKLFTKVEAHEGISQAEAQSLVPEILKSARTIPMYLIPGNKGLADGEVDLEFYKVRLHPGAPESAITLIRGAAYLVDRLVYGEMHAGKYHVLWDSPLLSPHGALGFHDLYGDGWKEIVWDDRLPGGVSLGAEQLVVFDKEGREISRQEPCSGAASGYYGFDGIDGVCPIEGDEIRLDIISDCRVLLPETEPGPKDIVAERSAGSSIDGKEHTYIYTLEKGMYVLSKLDASQLAAVRKAKKVHDAAVLNEQGMGLMKKGEYEAAITKFEEAGNLSNWENPVYSVNLSQADYKLGNYEDAVGDIGVAIQLNYAIAYLYRGDALVQLHRETENRPDYKDYLEHVCAENGNRCLAEARKDYEKYLELAPNSKLAPEVRKKLAALPPSP